MLGNISRVILGIVLDKFLPLRICDTDFAIIKIDEVQLMSDQLKEVKCNTKVNPIIILP